MRIGIDCSPLSGVKTGIGYYLWEILNAWGEMEISHDLVLYAARDFEVPSKLATSNVRYQQRVFRMRPAEAWMHSVLPVLIRRDDLDLFWGPNYAMPLIPMKVPSVLTVHDMVYRVHPETMKRVTYLHNRYGLERYVQRCRGILVPSQSTKDDIVHFLNLNPEMIEVTPLGVSNRFGGESNDIEVLHSLSLIGMSYFLTVGTLEPRKNLYRIIEAFEMASEMLQDDPVLVVVGAVGWGQVSSELATRYGDRVVYLGYVPDKVLGTLYRGARAFVYLPLYEGFGLPPLEAMDCGTPVLVSSTSSLPEVVGSDGLFANPYNTEEMANGMVRLWTDKELRESLVKRGKMRADGMNWRRTATHTLDALERAVSGKR